MKDLKNILYAIIFSTIGGLVSVTGYNYFYPRGNSVVEINNDKVQNLGAIANPEVIKEYKELKINE